MEPISIRYGESLTLPLQTGDTSAVSADIFIGRPGEAYLITKHVALTDGGGYFVFTPVDTSVPLGTYYYQINVTDVNSKVGKYPSPSNQCNDDDGTDFPRFIICEALDEMEIS